MPGYLFVSNPVDVSLLIEWLDGLAIHHDASGDTILRGQIKDQAALLGILNKLYSLNLTLTGLIRVEDT